MVKIFFAPKDIDEALQLKNNNSHSLYLAGGTLVNSGGKSGEISIISLHLLELEGIKKEGSHITIGSMTTLQEISESELLKEEDLGEIQDSCRAISRNIRNASTIGGALGSNYSRSDIIPVLMVSDAIVTLKADQKSEMTVCDYISKRSQGYSPLILSVKIPIPAKNELIISKRFSRTSLDLPLVKLAIKIKLQNGKIESVRIAAGGVSDSVTELKDLEKYLENTDIKAAKGNKEIDRIFEQSLTSKDDIRATADYKKHLIKVMFEEIFTECMKGKN